MAARNNRNRHRRSRGRFGFLYKLLCVLLIFAAVLVGSVVFFRVNEVTVEGQSRYSAEELVAASGVKTGDNLFLVNKPQTALNITRQLPYVENVSVVRRLPDTLELRITETTAVAAVQADGAWWLIDARGKVLEQGDAALRGSYPEVLGLTPLSPAVGTRLSVAEEEQLKLDSLRSLLTALKTQTLTAGLKGFIDLSSVNAIHFGYGDDLTVTMPMSDDFETRAFNLRRTLDTLTQRGEALSGTLDLTYEDEGARLLPTRWLPENYTAPEGGTADAGTDTGDVQPAESTAPEPSAAPNDGTGLPAPEEPSTAG